MVDRMLFIFPGCITAAPRTAGFVRIAARSRLVAFDRSMVPRPGDSRSGRMELTEKGVVLVGLMAAECCAATASLQPIEIEPWSVGKQRRTYLTSWFGGHWP